MIDMMKGNSYDELKCKSHSHYKTVRRKQEMLLTCWKEQKTRQIETTALYLCLTVGRRDGTLKSKETIYEAYM